MSFAKEITDKVSMVNEVLNEIKIPHLLENPDFFVDEMTMESWLKVDLKDNGENRIPLNLTFTKTGLEVRLDRIAEALDWSNKDFRESKVVIKSIIKNLFTSHILVEYHGLSRTRISLFAQNGKCTNTFKYQENLSFKEKREDRLYFPVYSYTDKNIYKVRLSE